MRTYVGGHQAVSHDDFIELALGTPLELWLGVEGETAEEQAARLDAARDILAEYPDLYDTVTRLAVETIQAHAPDLLNVIQLTGPGKPKRRKAVAA
ncbi:hypothetical protein [Streptomyces sp. NPDC002402]